MSHGAAAGSGHARSRAKATGGPTSYSVRCRTPRRRASDSSRSSTSGRVRGSMSSNRRRSTRRSVGSGRTGGGMSRRVS